MAAQKKKQDQGDRLVSKNRRATFDYTLGETIEAGLVLMGSEVRALREGPANLVEAWVELDRRGEAWVKGMRIATLKHAAFAHEEIRTRKQGKVHPNVFDPPVPSGQSLIDEQRLIAKQRTSSQSTVRSNHFASVDFETSNAQEWDEVPLSRSRTVVKEPKPKTVGNGKANSRFAVLADEAEEKCKETETAQVMSQEQKQQVSDLVDAKVYQFQTFSPRYQFNLRSLSRFLPRRTELPL